MADTGTVDCLLRWLCTRASRIPHLLGCFAPVGSRARFGTGTYLNREAKRTDVAGQRTGSLRSFILNFPARFINTRCVSVLITGAQAAAPV